MNIMLPMVEVETPKRTKEEVSDDRDDVITKQCLSEMWQPQPQRCRNEASD